MDKFFDYIASSNATLFAGVALVFGAIRMILMPSDRSLKTFLTTFFICIPVGTIAGGVCFEQFGGKVWLSLAVASTASFLAEKLLMALYEVNIKIIAAAWWDRVWPRKG